MTLEEIDPRKLIPNYDESLVPNYELPDPLVFENGSEVNQENWKSRRDEILALFRENIYGYPPGFNNQFEVKVKREVSLNGIFFRRDMDLIFNDGQFILPVLLFLPKKSSNPAPVFVGFNFQGNHTVHPDSTIDIPEYWVRDRADLGSDGHKASPGSRGMQAACWPVEMITSRGYALLTADYCALAADNSDHFSDRIYQVNQVERTNNSGGAIATWAWGLSRMRESLINIAEVNADKASTIGHSRLGKTALWAAAEDDSFSMAVSIQSGQNGAALGRRCYGERIADGIRQFPYWYTPNFREFVGREHELPVDQHELLSLIAPRPLYVTSANDDKWCDPKGEFLACVAANKVFKLLGKSGLNEVEVPAMNHSIGENIGYHLRPGPHSVLPADWYHILNFTDKHLK